MAYFRIAGIILLFTGASHLMGHFLIVRDFQLIYDITAYNTEKDLQNLLNYHRTVGGTPVSIMDIQNGLSLCYALFLLWTGSLALVIHKPLRRNHRLLTRISFLYAVMLFIALMVSLIYFFWLPVTCFAGAFLFFLLAGIQYSRSQQF